MPPEFKQMFTIALMASCSVTMLLGLFPNRTIYGEIPFLTIAREPMLGVGQWGYVLPWLRRIVYPGSPLEVVWQNLVADLTMWTLLSYVLISIIRTCFVRKIQ